MVVVIKRSANLKGGKLPKCILGCERGRKYEPPRHHSEGQPLQRNTETKKCDCPFKLRGLAIPPDGVMWGLLVKCGFHNHETAKYLDSHEYPSRLKPVEKQFVVEMAGSTKPREILNVLKERDSSNTTGIQSIYNIIARQKVVQRGGLNPMQHVLDQLISKRYLHAFMTNPATNEITDIVWVHPKSLDLFINFPTVLIIDATYKTNEYRIPLLEVVGITSTMQTYSLMFAYLANEKSDRLTWAVGTLKNLMVEKEALMPSVLVSDRDLTLMKAIETCFPAARHILCIWHINQNVVKYCSPILGSEMTRFFASWHSLIKSSTPESYQQKWHILVGEFKSYPRATKYLWETWLRSYKERFIDAWLDTCMHLGSNSSQRAESAHARLKLYLGDTMSSLDTSFGKIHKMLRIQFGSIQKSFERSLNIQRHNKELTPFSVRTSEVVELLQGMDPSTRDNMITRIIDMTDPSHRSRGASNSSPDGSITLPATTSRLRKDQPTAPPMSDPFIQELPEAYQDFISHIVDVQANGHCGFRAIAAQIGYGEDNWAQIHHLIEEQEKGKRTLWFDKFVDGFLVTSSHALPTRRHLPHTKFVTTILVGVSWHWPFLAIMNTCIGNYRYIENDPISAKEICTAYIEKLCKAGNLSVAARLLQSLRDKHIYLSSNAYNLLLEAAGESNDIGLVSQSFKDLLVFGEPISSISYFNLAKAFKTRNDAVLLLGFIKEVSELTFPRSATVANRIILAFAECGQIDNALLIFDHMKSLKCKPDLFTYNTVLGILGRVGRADEMLHEFASMKETNVVPDIVSYNTLINSLRKLGRLDLCLVFLKELEERRFEPDLRTYTALIESFGRSGNVEELLRLFNEMKRRCIRPSIYIYRSLINNIKKMDLFGLEGLQTETDSLAFQIPPDVSVQAGWLFKSSSIAQVAVITVAFGCVAFGCAGLLCFRSVPKVYFSQDLLLHTSADGDASSYM
ncbi:hypothetical protein Acr_13g0004800 [Actinidia rufa]|uniref:MULE transposase domain-containing protein n=1 Tax=Actinidia rufa TaxID=165716 RepID=A0A7J0FLM0_9ERIC|nr:hypothetical protein Acr_13g0004800 [Actinidia rufa]